MGKHLEIGIGIAVRAVGKSAWSLVGGVSDAQGVSIAPSATGINESFGSGPRRRKFTRVRVEKVFLEFGLRERENEVDGNRRLKILCDLTSNRI